MIAQYIYGPHRYRCSMCLFVGYDIVRACLEHLVEQTDHSLIYIAAALVLPHSLMLSVFATVVGPLN